jgi:drug/metabolite transporter (DMT)-like permease
MGLFRLGFLSLALVGYNHGFAPGGATTRSLRIDSPSHPRCSYSCPSNRISSTVPIKKLPGLVLLPSTNSDLEETDEAEAAKADKLLGILVLLTVPLSWGTYVPVVRYLYAIQPPVPGFVFSACYYTLAAITTSSLAIWQSRKSQAGANDPKDKTSTDIPIVAGLELGAYLFIANCLQVVGLRTVESDRAGFLVQLTTVMVPFVEALFAGNLAKVPIRTWFACVFAFIGLFVMGLDGKIMSDPVSSFVAAVSSFNQGDLLIMGAAVLYTLHVVRLGAYAKTTTPMKLAASKATSETIFSIILVGGLTTLSSIVGEQTGLLGFASSTGKEILQFFASFREGLLNGSLSPSVLWPAVGAVFWTGWVTCAYTIYAQSFGQSRVTPTNANLIYTFQPIFTALFGWLLLGETMGPSGFLGGAIIASSVYMVASANLGGGDAAVDAEATENGSQQQEFADDDTSSSADKLFPADSSEQQAPRVRK